MNSPVFVVFFLVLLSWRAAEASRCSMPLADVCTVPAETAEAGFYDLHLSSQEYSTTKLGKTQISVQVKMASTSSCPTLQTPGPKYYKLEAYVNDTSAAAGTFNDPPQASEAEACPDKEIVFSSCTPHVTDLPRAYGWNAPSTYVGNICFRLTILKEGENKCEEIVRCITPDKLTPSGNVTQEPEQNSTVAVELETVYLTEPDSYTSEHAAACYKKRNCTNAKLKTMCASDGNEYPSRCHAKLEQCLTGHKINILHPGECIPPSPSPTPPPSNCPQERESFLNSSWDTSGIWVPTCDCQGYYKPIQCEGSRCWCSTRKDGFLRGEKKDFDCGRTDFSECVL